MTSSCGCYISLSGKAQLSSTLLRSEEGAGSETGSRAPFVLLQRVPALGGWCRIDHGVKPLHNCPDVAAILFLVRVRLRLLTFWLVVVVAVAVAVAVCVAMVVVVATSRCRLILEHGVQLPPCRLQLYRLLWQRLLRLILRDTKAQLWDVNAAMTEAWRLSAHLLSLPEHPRLRYQSLKLHVPCPPSKRGRRNTRRVYIGGHVVCMHLNFLAVCWRGCTHVRRNVAWGCNLNPIVLERRCLFSGGSRMFIHARLSFQLGVRIQVVANVVLGFGV